MKTHLGLIASLVLLIATPLWAHHPAEDILDDEIYAMIDDNVADTPHATLTFDDMGNTIITTESVSDAEDLLSSSLLAAFSLLGDLDQQVETAADALLYFSEQTADSNLPEEPLTLTITYGPYIEPDDQDVLDTIAAIPDGLGEGGIARGMGHLIMMEDPQGLAEACLGFLRRRQIV